jgi:hypothetical protein
MPDSRKDERVEYARDGARGVGGMPAERAYSVKSFHVIGKLCFRPLANAAADVVLGACNRLGL